MELVFCSYEQKNTNHTMTVDRNSEMVLICDCGHFIKLPGKAVTNKSYMNELLYAHKVANQRQ